MSTMNKSEIVGRVRARTGMSKTDATRAVEEVFAAVTEGLAHSGPVRIAGFGTFTVKHRAERTGRNPRSGEPVTIPAAAAAVFKPAKEVRAALNGGA